MELCGQIAVCGLWSNVTAGRCFVGTRMASAGAGMAKIALLKVDGTVRGRWMWDDVVEGALPTE